MFRAACNSEGSATFTGQVTGRDRNWPAVEMASVQHPARKRVSPRATLGSGRAHWAAILKDSTSRTKATPAAPTDRKVLGGGPREELGGGRGHTLALDGPEPRAAGPRCLRSGQQQPPHSHPTREAREASGRQKEAWEGAQGHPVSPRPPSHPCPGVLAEQVEARRSAQHEAQPPGCWLSRKPPSGAPKGPPFKVTSEGGLLAPHPFGTWS